jgi:hypothetical protein
MPARYGIKEFPLVRHDRHTLPKAIECKRGKRGDEHHRGNVEHLVPLRDVQ